jgi:hypothetical protein
MAADDGHNALCTEFCCPSLSFFERPVDGKLIWCFPPTELIPLLLKFLDAKRRARESIRIVILVPEKPQAPWFQFLQHYHRVARYRQGSDLFRVRGNGGEWAKLPATRSPFLVLQSCAM